MQKPYPRDMIGYGARPPDPRWPGEARIALQFVVNFEEGAENCVLHGDSASETFLTETPDARAIEGMRNLNVESDYEYGSRAGFWRLQRILLERGVPVTVFGVAMALERNPEAVAALREADWEIASHGWRWIDYQTLPASVEREHLRRALSTHERVTGSRPLGWYLGRVSPNTRRLIVEEGGFLYDSDYYGDDLPFWTVVTTADGRSQPHLIVPYTLDTNDMRFATASGFANGTEFFDYLRDAFDVLYAEGEERPKMMSVGLHCRLAGRPGKLAGLERFLRHALGHQDVWFCRRIEIARHWRAVHPAAE